MAVLRYPVLWAVVAWCLSSGGRLAGQERSWRGRDGQAIAEGRLLDVRDKQVTVFDAQRRATVAFSLDQLAEEDRRYVDNALEAVRQMADRGRYPSELPPPNAPPPLARPGSVAWQAAPDPPPPRTDWTIEPGWQMELPEPETGSSHQLYWLQPGSPYVVLASRRSSRLLNLATGRIESELHFSDTKPWNRPQALSPDGRFLVIVRNEVEVWSFETGERISTLQRHGRTSDSSAAIDPRDVQLLMRTSDRVLGRYGRLGVWDVASGQVVSTLSPISTMALLDVSPGGAFAIARSRPWSLTLVDVRNAERAGQLEVPMPGGKNEGSARVRFSPNGREFAVLDYYRTKPNITIACFDMAGGQLTQRLEIPFPVRWVGSADGPPWAEFFQWLPDGSGWRVGQVIVLRHPSLRHGAWGDAESAAAKNSLPEPWQFAADEMPSEADRERILPIQIVSQRPRLDSRLGDRDTVLTAWQNSRGWWFGALAARKD